METLSKGELTSRGAELASGDANQHLLMRHLCAAHTKILAWVFCIRKPMQLNAKIYVLKVRGRGNAMTTYARSETHSCATHCA